ncbi:MAG TPA: Rieske 2Fe-2S domain-containing protein, partial [Dokdonella sp.]|nr:Rieske 2Fe-2S domain-containing protein [Dokdonella sp.]
MAIGSHDPEFAAQALAQASALPAHHYVGSAAEALDRRAVFGHSWQLVAHAAQLGGVGDHVVAEIAGVPLVVVRGDDGELRALHNV